MRTNTLAWSLVAAVALIGSPLHAQDVSAKVVFRGDTYRSYRRVERFRRGEGEHGRREGFREVIVYYVGGRYYDRFDWRRHRVHKIVVYERDGRYYRAE